MYIILFLWFLVLNGASSQTFIPSSSWRKPNIITSPSERVDIARAALELAISHLNISDAQFDGRPFGVAGILYAQMAEFDLLTNQTKYQSDLKNYFSMAEKVRPLLLDELYLNYGLAYGYAATRAYAAYKDQDFLIYAQDSWTSAKQYTLSDGDVVAGSIASKDFPIEPNCQGITMAGGTFWNTDMDEATLNGLGTGSFLILSAALAEATNDQTYAAAAEKSIDFFRTHLYNADNIVQDSISARQNDSCSTNILILPSNAGLFIEGLAILVSQDVSRQQLLEDTISAAIPNQAWQGPDGVINTTIGNLELVRALATVYNRNSTSSDMRSYIRGYLAVQYNAVIELATEEGSNIYTSLWLGPPSSQFLADNQTAALAALIAAISLTNDTATPSGDPIPAPSSSSPARSTSTPVGTIVGSVIGGISFVLITGIAWSLLRRRKRRQNSQRSYRVSLESDNPLYAGQTGSHQIHVNSLRTPASVPQTDVTTNQASISPLQPQRLTEKRALRNNPQRQQWSPRLDSDTWTPGTGNPSSNWSGSNTRSSRRDMTTAELVRMLNERLQPGQWREDEMPPEYPESSRSR